MRGDALRHRLHGRGASPTVEHLLVFLKADYKLERKLVDRRRLARAREAHARQVARAGDSRRHQHPSSTESTVSSSDMRGAYPSTCRARRSSTMQT